MKASSTLIVVVAILISGLPLELPAISAARPVLAK
jgi:hypothetical protein